MDFEQIKIGQEYDPGSIHVGVEELKVNSVWAKDKTG
jgi:hypothetical protein